MTAAALSATVSDWLSRVDFWLVLGFFAQILFSARFIVQWIASERAGRSVVPLLFWYLSLSGSSLLLIYAIHRRDPVFILGQGAGVAIYLRNLHLIFRERRQGTTPGGSAVDPDELPPDPPDNAGDRPDRA